MRQLNMPQRYPRGISELMKIKNCAVIILFFFVAVWLRSLNLARGFFGDEAITLMSASQSTGNIIPTLVKHDVYPPLTSFLLHFWMQISNSEVFLRYYFILFGIGVLWLVYLIAGEWLPKKNGVALLALFLAAISPLQISLSQFFRNYIDSAFWMLLSTYFLILIVKDKEGFPVWIGYFASSVLSIYTFYFSLILVFCQSIYVFIFKLKDKTVIKRILIAQGCTIILFLPWIKYFILQLSNKTSSKLLHWERFGFKFAGLDLGIYARNIAALFGMDYFFMVYPEGIRNHFGGTTLLMVYILALAIFCFFLFFCLKWLKEAFKDDKKLMWFIPFFSLMPLLISWISAKAMGTLPNARYLAMPHAIFLILVAHFIYTLCLRNKKLGVFFLTCLFFLYCIRIPMAVSAIYEGKNALDYLRSNIRGDDCTLMVDRLPGRENLGIPYLSIANDIFERDPATSEYRFIYNDNTVKLKDELKKFKRIWFIRCYGNTEIFAGNKITYDFLKSCGRKESAAKEFNNIKIILME